MHACYEIMTFFFPVVLSVSIELHLLIGCGSSALPLSIDAANRILSHWSDRTG